MKYATAIPDNSSATTTIPLSITSKLNSFSFLYKYIKKIPTKVDNSKSTAILAIVTFVVGGAFVAATPLCVGGNPLCEGAPDIPSIPEIPETLGKPPKPGMPGKADGGALLAKGFSLFGIALDAIEPYLVNPDNIILLLLSIHFFLLYVFCILVLVTYNQNLHLSKTLLVLVVLFHTIFHLF